MSSCGRRWRSAAWEASSAARTTAGEPASASASWRRSRRYRSTSEATCVARSWPRAFACRSTIRLALRLERRANPVTRARATAAPVTRKLCRSCGVRLDMMRVGSEATQGYPVEQACLISWTYDSGPDVRSAAVEAKWQEHWARDHTNEPDLDRPRRPFCNLMMFPYPSAEGLHVGNMFAFTGADIYGRFKRLEGHDVFEPIGFDAFGIHSENYALSVGINPAQLIPKNIETFRRQLRRFGGMFDWRHELSTTDQIGRAQ